MVSSKQFLVDMMRKRLEREAYCKKMWTEIEEKREEIRKDVETFRKKLRGEIKVSGEGR